jgi:hypothetical protein
MAKPPDEEIRRRWTNARRLHDGRSSLARRLALLEAEDLEREGVTEEDIERLFPLTPTQEWLRDHFVDPGMA